MSLNSLFSGVFDDATSTVSVGIGSFLLCMVVALALGCLVAYLYSKGAQYTKSFITTLAIIPAVVALIIMMVNGNIGTGVAIAGAFSLVRFRSVPGSAREIGALFIAVGAGLAIGMGYIGFAIVYVVVVSGFNLFLAKSGFGQSEPSKRLLTITVPEDLNYTNMFEDLFLRYTKSATLSSAKTSNMGSLFKLRYEIEMIDPQYEKALIDELRCRNGNLEIAISNQAHSNVEL